MRKIKARENYIWRKDVDCFIGRGVEFKDECGDSNDIEDHVNFCCETLQEKQRDFLRLYAHQPLFIFAHGYTSKGRQYIGDGKRNIDLHRWLVRLEKKSDYDCFFCVCCGDEGVALSKLARATVIASSIPDAHTTCSIQEVLTPQTWYMRHPEYGDMEYIYEWAIKKKRPD